MDEKFTKNIEIAKKKPQTNRNGEIKSSISQIENSGQYPQQIRSSSRIYIRNGG
jgi:hypothetical protein